MPSTIKIFCVPLSKIVDLARWSKAKAAIGIRSCHFITVDGEGKLKMGYALLIIKC